MITISMLDANDFIETAILDDTAYRLHFSFNGFSSQWTVDVLTATNKEIVRGIAIVPNFPLFNQCKRNGLPRGELAAIVVKPELSDCQTIGRKDFVNGKFAMVYISESEVVSTLGAG